MCKLSFFLLVIIGIGTSGYAEVQVIQEPRHHKVLGNEWVRVLDVRIPPHDTTLMHKHSTPSVFVMISNVKSGSQVLVEPGKARAWLQGHCSPHDEF
ncbi:MAG TPA: hypothetical protein VN616_09945 [Puia sp.]|nr:hypothetical protein [Puia sp.]